MQHCRQKHKQPKHTKLCEEFRDFYSHFRGGGKLGRKTGYRKSKEQKQEQYAGVIKLLKKGYPVRDIAKIENVGISTVMRLKREFIKADD